MVELRVDFQSGLEQQQQFDTLASTRADPTSPPVSIQGFSMGYLVTAPALPEGSNPIRVYCEHAADAFEVLYRLQLRGISRIVVTGPDGKDYDADGLLQTSRSGEV
jgi:hypothetical protein